MLLGNEQWLWIKQNVNVTWLWFALIGFSSLGILWNLASLFFASPLPEFTPQTEMIRPAIDKGKLLTRLRTPLFGTFIPTPKETTVEDSRLPYTIVGIMYSEASSESQAVIQEENGQSKVYRAGDKLGGRLLIKAIELDSVIILNQGRLERLSLPKNDLRFEGAPEPLMMKENE